MKSINLLLFVIYLLFVICAFALGSMPLRAAEEPDGLCEFQTDPLENESVANAPKNQNTIRGLSRQMRLTLAPPPSFQPRQERHKPPVTQETSRPNIVFCMADDWSWPHASILGDPIVRTPNFDRIANEGVLFENAFVSTPSCTPSRLSILAGQHHWRLREGDSLGGSLREEYDVYTDMLQEAGQPFCCWHGGQDPHRPYEFGIGEKSGIELSDVKVPACLPDNETIRSDVADYLWEVTR